MRRVFITIALLGLVIAFGARFEAARRYNPSSVTLGGHEFDIVHTDQPNVGIFTFIDSDDGREKGSVSAENHLCDPPFTFLFDVDDDGARDLYYRGCNGAGLVVYVPERDEVELRRIEAYSDWPEGARSWWFREWVSGGWTMTLVGVGLMVVGLIGMVATRRRS